MAIVLKKKIPVPITQIPEVAPALVQDVPDDIVALIDKLALMQRDYDQSVARIKAEAAKLQPYKETMKALMALVTDYEGKEPGAGFELDGTLGTAKMSKRYKVRTVAQPEAAVKLLNKVKKGLGWELISIPLGKLDAYLTPAECAEVIASKDGERTVEIVPDDKAIAKALAAAKAKKAA